MSFLLFAWGISPTQMRDPFAPMPYRGKKLVRDLLCVASEVVYSQGAPEGALGWKSEEHPRHCSPGEYSPTTPAHTGISCLPLKRGAMFAACTERQTDCFKHPVWFSLMPRSPWACQFMLQVRTAFFFY